MELLAYGDTGWGDELFFATLMTIAVALAALLIGFVLANYKKLIIYHKIKIILLNFVFFLFYLLNYENFMSNTNSPNVSLIFITLLQTISAFTLFSFIY